MAEPRWLNPQEMDFWRAFLDANLRVLGAIDADLRADSGITSDDYEVLVRLSEAPDRSIRMSELSEQVVQSRSRLTQRVDRLVSRGWIRRERCPEDRRGAFAVLTEEGFEALATAAPMHVASVRRHLIDRIDPDALPAGTALLRSVLADDSVTDATGADDG
jgi:DNA-binding MarR family transcriptional regulator